MNLFPLAILAVIALWFVRAKDQRQRIALLASHLGPHQIEKHMETLTQGYLRALGEADGQRRDQIFSMLQSTEQALAAQMRALAVDFAKVDAAHARVSRLPLYLPWLTRLLPAATFDMRQALVVHADGIGRMVEAVDLPARERAFTLSAELFLLQHTCHWFCKSRMVASARMLARHQTAYAQLVQSVSAPTRAAYQALVG
ncbi:MAG: hypothetical protein LCH79_07305 [Proteobacteria bacterium]|mgnify:CR=1 FL=1|jgi:hypothetical protein|nr:hypothetical protein [Ramlibacter sp.]MCA0212966.1 hypothetical protein [Pseudomonadota bacterium]